MATGIAVIIASHRRPIELGRWLDHVARQTVPPVELIWAVTGDDDLPPARADGAGPRATIVRSEPGLTKQRNRGLAAIRSDPEFVAFFDDDYVPAATCLEDVAATFAAMPDVVGLTGTLLSDGINSAGIAYDAAAAQVAAYERGRRGPVARPSFEPWDGLYGCNMVFRADVIGDERFDERLPLYAWQEDIDFAVRVARGRPLGRTDGFVGVHQGVKGGRTGGKRLGYSQIVNPVYLNRKGSMTWRKVLTLASRNVAANHLRMFRPEPWIDRRGRAIGNWLGLADVLRGRADPMRVLEL